MLCHAALCRSVAVQTPIGLMVPIVRDADAKGLAEIAAEVKALAAKVGSLASGAAEASGAGKRGK